MASVGVLASAGSAFVAVVSGSRYPTPRPDGICGELDVGYVEEVTGRLGAIGSCRSGSACSARPRTEQTADYLAEEMEAIGLEDVAVEEFTGDGWLFEGGSVHGGGLRPEPDVRGIVDRRCPGNRVRRRFGRSSRWVRPGARVRGLDVRRQDRFARWDYDGRGIWPNYIAYEAKLARREGGDHRVGARTYVVRGGRRASARQQRRGMQHDGVCADRVISKTVGGQARRALRRGTGRTATVTVNGREPLRRHGHQPIGQITGSRHPDREDRVHRASGRLVHVGGRRLGPVGHGDGHRQGGGRRAGTSPSTRGSSRR